jgi:hypothetical protein
VLEIYKSLAQLASTEFNDLVIKNTFIGGTPANPNKLRLTLTDGSFLDVCLSADGDYSYHWERRRQRGKMYRWDNAPHHPRVFTFPHHKHDGDEATIVESRLSSSSETALRQVLEFVRQHLT